MFIEATLQASPSIFLIMKLAKKKNQQTPYFELKENNIKNLKKTNTNHKINTQLSDKNDSDKVCCSIKKIEAYKFKTKCNYATESFS